jgi:uncharacterized protein YndB with AHSA1/START domain
VRNGKVTEVERPTRIAFQQPMTMKFGAGVINVTVTYTLTPRATATHVRRVVSVGLPWQLKPSVHSCCRRFALRARAPWRR